MKKLFLTEFDGSDKIADYSDICDRKIRGRMKKRLTLARRKMYTMQYKKDEEQLQEVYAKKSSKCTL